MRRECYRILQLAWYDFILQDAFVYFSEEVVQAVIIFIGEVSVQGPGATILAPIFIENRVTPVILVSHAL
jgi:hypothetical protein